MPTLNMEKVLDAISSRPVKVKGGWSDPATDGKSHFMGTALPATDGTAQVYESLCGEYEAEGDPDDLIECDPLAAENCTTCRRVLLQRRNLI